MLASAYPGVVTARAPLIVAHRGASGYRPEHSRSAYELAIALGADAIEPDIVASKDGVLVLRHENEISGTTDVAARPEFASRQTTKVIDGSTVTGWFTEDFTWEELSTLRVRERLPELRTASASFDGSVGGILRLRDLLGILDAASRPVVLVAEIKHATYFASIGLSLAELFAAEVDGWATDDNLIIESFEATVLGQVRALGVPGRLVYLVEDRGAPADRPSRSYAADLTESGLAEVAHSVDGISVDKALLLPRDAAGQSLATTDLVERAHAAGLTVFCWTLRAENAFLPANLRVGSAARDFGRWREEFGLLLDTGLDGVFADQPDLVRELLA